jgi:hypothetical protein
MDENGSGQIIFEGEEQQVSRSAYDEIPKITQFVMNFSGGLIKTKGQANYAMLVFIFVAVIASLSLLFKSGPKAHPPTPAEMQRMEMTNSSQI